MSKLKYLSLFSGIGSPEMALRDLGIEYDLVGFSEIDEKAIKSYCAIHGVSKNDNLGDITKIDAEALPKDIDLITHGSPCFTADSLILTSDGYKNIVDVCIGDKVLTHTGAYKTVTNFLEQGKKEIWEINGMAFDKIRTTENHKFFVRKKEIIQDNKSNNKIRSFTNPVWVECKDLSKDYYLGMSINSESKLPIWNGIECTRGRDKYIKNNIDLTDKRFWYLCGRFVGDGWIRRRKERNNNISGAIICCGKHEDKDFESKIGDVFNYTKVEDRTVYKYQFSNKELGIFLNQFGIGAKNKFIPGFILDLPIDYLKCFLNGYFDSDGSYNDKKEQYSATTISRELAYGIGHCIAKAYKKPFSIYKTIRPKQYTIEGRTVNQNDSYIIRFLSNPKKAKSFYEDGYIWYPIKDIVNTGIIEDVYDITVDEDHSFVVNSCIAHNCQDFSISGVNAGGDEGTGTRSSLMWNTVNICEKVKPKYVVWENVKGVLQKSHIHNFEKYLERMEQIGYVNYYKVLNAKHFGVAQDRERIFVVSIRKDINIDFEFPQEYDYEVKLRDVLDEKVDERFYIKKILNPRRTKKYLQYDNSGKGYNSQASRLYYLDGQMCTLPKCNGGDKTQVLLDEEKLTGRRITPYEAWRLMGFSMEDFQKAEQSGQTLGSLYGQAGNSIVLPVIKGIFEKLFLS